MNRFVMMAVAVVMLTAVGAARAAEKEAPIDWPARAATVKVGMTRAEVEKILPPMEEIKGGTIINHYANCTYRVSNDWEVTAMYDLLSAESSTSPAVSKSRDLIRDLMKMCASFYAQDGKSSGLRLALPVKIEKLPHSVTINGITYFVPPKPTP